MASGLTEIVIVTRNGYANRLQAWASSAILASELDAALAVVWEPEAIAPASFADLFAPTEAAPFTVMAPAELEQWIGGPHTALPRYLTIDAQRRLVILAGHDRGEQAFMDELDVALAHPCEPTTLLIIAGGKFAKQGRGDFGAQRRSFYRALPWHPSIAERVAGAVDGRQPFLGLHVRGTDRSRTAPTTSMLCAGVGDLVARTGIRSVFLAADSTAAREQWQGTLQGMGLDPWTMPRVDLDRSTRTSGIDALVDWCILGRSGGLVYSAASSFGEEAAACSGEPSVALTSGPLRQHVRRIDALIHSARSYPRRHWN